jgi:hypothetical protein
VFLFIYLTITSCLTTEEEEEEEEEEEDSLSEKLMITTDVFKK